MLLTLFLDIPVFCNAEPSQHSPIVWHECASMQLNADLGALQGLQIVTVRPSGSDSALKLVNQRCSDKYLLVGMQSPQSTECAVATGCGAHINAMWCDLLALEMGHLTARPVFYGDVRACWQVGIQRCGGCRHKERDAANDTVHQHRPGCLLSDNWLHTPDGKVSNDMKTNTVHQQRCNSHHGSMMGCS